MLRARNYKNQCSARSNIMLPISHHHAVVEHNMFYVYRYSWCIKSVYLRLSERGVACFLLDMMRVIPHDSRLTALSSRLFISLFLYIYIYIPLFLSFVLPLLNRYLFFVFAQVPRRARRCKRDHAILPTDQR